jgi:NifU-like protein involved in Fe-S cluster formation
MNAAFAAWLADETATPPNSEMQDFTPVRQIKNRHKCVLLTFEAAAASINAK